MLTALDCIGQQRREFRFDLRYRTLTGCGRKELERAVEDEFPYLPAGLLPDCAGPDGAEGGPGHHQSSAAVQPGTAAPGHCLVCRDRAGGLAGAVGRVCLTAVSHKRLQDNEPLDSHWLFLECLLGSVRRRL